MKGEGEGTMEVERRKKKTANKWKGGEEKRLLTPRVECPKKRTTRRREWGNVRQLFLFFCLSI
jgi:hypothetical protein